jgi:CRISPR/Cas system-associated exonuclease Cas4 (RecB family)
LLVKANFRKNPADRELADKIGKIFEEGYANKRRPDGFVQKKTFAPSSIGPKYDGSCSRRWVLAFQGQQWEETAKALNLSVMGAGTDSHAELQKILEDAGVAVAIEKELTLSDPPIRGFADAIITVDGQDYVGEIKTTNTQAFEHYQFAGKPNVSHIIQVMIYMYITGLPGFVMYQDRNSRQLLVLPLRYDDHAELLDKTFAWLRAVYAAYKNEQLPTRDLYAYGTKPSKICQSCPVRKACAELPSGDITIGKFEV